MYILQDYLNRSGSNPEKLVPFPWSPTTQFTIGFQGAIPINLGSSPLIILPPSRNINRRIIFLEYISLYLLLLLLFVFCLFYYILNDKFKSVDFIYIIYIRNTDGLYIYIYIYHPSNCNSFFLLIFRVKQWKCIFLLRFNSM